MENVAGSDSFRLLLLSTSSSLDNFVVGVSLGVHGGRSPHRLNGIVAVANGLGACLSAGLGSAIGDFAPMIASLCAAGIFLWLGFSELSGYWRCEPSPLSSLALKGVAWRLALPMTLNNLAGGIAGGIAHLDAIHLGLAACLASFVLMFFGHVIGKGIHGVKSSRNRLDPRLLAGLAFFVLALSQLSELLFFREEEKKNTVRTRAATSNPFAAFFLGIIGKKRKRIGRINSFKDKPPFFRNHPFFSPRIVEKPRQRRFHFF